MNAEHRARSNRISKCVNVTIMRVRVSEKVREKDERQKKRWDDSSGNERMREIAKVDTEIGKDRAATGPRQRGPGKNGTYLYTYFL